MTVLNPFDLILSEIEELKYEVRKLKAPEPQVIPPENLTPRQALELLAENALPSTLAQLYKLSSLGEIPVSRIGKRLVFSRKELLNWIESRKIVKVSSSVLASEKLAISARRRERARR